MNWKCKSCNHYGFYQMITSGPYGYAGDIPCVSCIHFTMSQDNYEPVEYGKRWDALEGEAKDGQG